MNRRRKGKLADSKSKNIIEMACSQCGELENVDSDTVSVICGSCVAKRIPVEAKYLNPSTKQDPKDTKPRGWRFMKEFVDANGTVYHTGVEVPELKGTLPITDVVSLKASQKEKSKVRKQKKAERELKHEEKLVKEFKKKKTEKDRLEKKQAQEEKKDKFFGE